MASGNGGLTYQDARELLRGDFDRSQAFDVLATVAAMTSMGGEQTRAARELLIRSLEHRAAFAGCMPLLQALLREHGLFPYLNPGEVPLGDLIALEAHRPLDYDRDLVLHRTQALVYRLLLDGKSVVLSAPTSFGKSLILDAVIGSGRFDNIAVVVPTIALVDETRRRLARFSDRYKVVTHPTQTFAERNLIVMTQERLLELSELPPLQLYMIDEFYKLDLDPRRGDQDRATLLNLAFNRLRRTGAAFYFAGPNISALADDLPEEFTASFVATSQGTVAVDLTVLPQPRRGSEATALVDVCQGLTGPTLIYCSSPAKVREAAAAMLSAGLGRESTDEIINSAADWVASEFHPEWIVAQAMRRGIGLHHGKMPRALAQHQVRAFNEGLTPFLLCTSTLIEGVNTSAKNVVVWNHQLARRNLDYFTFANIQGRSGRMGSHFVGNVFVFREPPRESLPAVDVPLLSQREETPESLLIHLDDEEASDQTRARLEPLQAQDDVPVDTLRDNAGLDPASQIALVQAVKSDQQRWLPLLDWRGYPSYEQLVGVCTLIVGYLRPVSGRYAGISSAAQLARQINLVAVKNGDFQELLLEELSNAYKTGDPTDAVEDVLEFLRTWPGYEFPRLLVALEKLVSPLVQRVGLRAPNYRAYASGALNLFYPEHLLTLEEYGLPVQIAMKLLPQLQPYEDLDGLLESLRNCDASMADLTRFERAMLESAQAGL